MGKSQENTALVFGLFETGLGVVRALGRKGIRVIGVDFKKDIAWYSRYVQPMQCPHPIQEEEQFVEWLLQQFSQGPKLPVYFTGDDFLFSFSRNRHRLAPYFLFNLPGEEQLERISDKYAQYQMALEAEVCVPKTWFVNNPEELESLEGDFDGGPLIIKGREVNSWRAYFGGSVKGFRVESLEELKAKLLPALRQGIPVIIQEIIEGPDTNHYEYCAYVSKNGELLAEFCYRKIRQNPLRFGIGVLVESVHDEQVMKEGRKLLKATGYRGVGNAEFKYDQKDGRLKYIEINTRYWQQCSLAEACGLNVPWLNFQDLLDGSSVGKPSQAYRPGVKWVNIYVDFDSFLKLRQEQGMSFRQWLKSLRGPLVFSDFSIDDPIPALWEIRFGARLLKLPGYFFHKISRRLFAGAIPGKLTA